MILQPTSSSSILLHDGAISDVVGSVILDSNLLFLVSQVKVEDDSTSIVEYRKVNFRTRQTILDQ